MCLDESSHQDGKARSHLLSLHQCELPCFCRFITRSDCFRITITVHTKGHEKFLNVWIDQTVAKSSKHYLMDICILTVSVALVYSFLVVFWKLCV